MFRPLFAARATSQDSPSLQPFALVGLVALLVFAIGAGLGVDQVHESFDAVETLAAEQRAGQQRRALEADLAQLSISARDHARWDDAWRYAQSEDPAFVSANLTDDSLNVMRVNVVLIVDGSGRVLHSSLLPEGAHALQSPAPDDVLADLVPVALATGTLGELPVGRRLVHSQRGAVAFAGVEITRTDGSEPSGRYLLFGRYVSAALMERVRQTSGLPVRWVALADPAAELSTATRAWIQGSGSRDTHAEPKSDEVMTSLSLVRSPDGKPLAVLASEAPRSITSLGQNLGWTLLGGLAALLLVCGSMLSWLLLRLHRTQLSRARDGARYRKVADQLTETILLVECPSLRVVEMNQAALHSMGYAETDIASLTALDIFPDLTREALAQEPENGRRVCRSRLRRKDGSEFDAEVTVSEFRDDSRDLLCLVGHDVSHRRAAEEQQKANQRKLLHMAQHDPLTGLPNRLFLRSKFPRVIRHAHDAQRGIALIYVDVDHFKNINDSLGHGHGDRLLQIIAQRLRNTVGAQDAVVRMGGDEFVIVATLVPEPASIDQLAQRLQSSICAPIVIDETPLAVTASMGLAVYPRDGSDLDVLLKHADIALYQAKEAGRHCHRFFDAHMDLRVSEDVALEQALRHALGSSQFYLEFQPVVDLRSNRVSSVEALLRWHHPELGQIPPGRFVPIAERAGLITQLGQFALENALHQMRAWLDVGVACVPMAINVAPQQLAHADFAELVKRLTAEVGIEPRWLRFEITENALLQNVQQLVGTLNQLREIGSQILIDDFGTGYSGLSYLTKLPVDTVKIDRSFVSSMMKGPKDEAVIASIIEMAGKLNLMTIAEGIETREQALRLRRLGCNFVQGYFFSRPLSARRCRRLLQKMHALGSSTVSTQTVATQAAQTMDDDRQAAAG